MKKHLKNPNKDGNITVSKSSLIDIIELTRVSPTSIRVLYTLANYADSNNSVISSIKSLSLILGIDKKLIKHCLTKLFNEGFIDIKKVEINHKQDLFKYIHNQEVYDLTDGAIWRVIGTELVDTMELSGIYNKFTINPAIIKCNGNTKNNILIHCSGILFYDTSIDNNEIIWED